MSRNHFERFIHGMVTLSRLEDLLPNLKKNLLNNVNAQEPLMPRITDKGNIMYSIKIPVYLLLMQLLSPKVLNIGSVKKSNERVNISRT